MAIQLKRQGAANAANCSSSPLKPTGLAYGEPAVDSAGYLYVGDGKGQVVSRTRYADSTGTASTANYSSLANNSNALSGLKVGNGVWSINSGFIPQVAKDGGMEIGKYIDFHQDQNSSADYNIRLNSNNSSLYITKSGGGYADLYTGWIRTQGQTGWLSSSYGGGWYMTDTSFIRAYGDKAIYTNNNSGGSWIHITRNAAFTAGKFVNASAGQSAQGYLSAKTQTGSWAIAGVSGSDSMFFVWGSDSNYNSNTNTTNTSIQFDTNGYIHAAKVYNAVYNDYAEFFPRGEDTEPGDIIALDTNSDKEQYIKATLLSKKIVGVHSNEYGHLIGGEKEPIGEDYIEYNLKKYIPVGLVGRCKVKIIGKVDKGNEIIPSDIPGVGKAYIDGIDDKNLLKNSIGFAVESSSDDNVKLIRVKLRG